MRKQILKHVLDKDGDGLESIVRDAIHDHLNNPEIKLHVEQEDHYLGQ